MRKIEIEIPEGKKAEWVNDVLTLVDEPKKCHEFKVGDKALLKRDTVFEQGHSICFVVAGAEVEIIEISDSIDIAEKIYKIKHQNATSVVFGCDLDEVS